MNLSNTIHSFDKKVIVHRDGFLCKLMIPVPLRDIDGHICCLGVNWGEQDWYIMPANCESNDTFQDVGPFQEFDDALLHFKLLSEVCPKT